MHITEPCIVQAAVLTSYWNAGDFTSVALLLAEVTDRAEAVNLVAGMLVTRDLMPEAITRISMGKGDPGQQGNGTGHYA